MKRTLYIHVRRRRLGISDVHSATPGRCARVAEGSRLIGRGTVPFLGTQLVLVWVAASHVRCFFIRLIYLFIY